MRLFSFPNSIQSSILLSNAGDMKNGSTECSLSLHQKRTWSGTCLKPLNQFHLCLCVGLLSSLQGLQMSTFVGLMEQMQLGPIKNIGVIGHFLLIILMI